MEKSILIHGKPLNKTEQKEVFGGNLTEDLDLCFSEAGHSCENDSDCCHDPLSQCVPMSNWVGDIGFGVGGYKNFMGCN